MQSVEDAVAVAIPVQARTNDKRLFLLARALLALRAAGPVTLDDELRAFDLWHERTGKLGFLRDSRDDYLAKFLRACARATRPLGESSLLDAWALAQSDGAPSVEAARVKAFKSAALARLLALCWQLSVASGGGVWYLAGGTAASLIGCSGVAAWGQLQALVRLGVLEIAELGTTHRATRYIYKPLDGGHEKARKLNHAKRHPDKQAR